MGDREFYEGIRSLMLPVPPDFCKVLGYTGDRKWVAFYWTPFSEKLAYYDAYGAGTIYRQGWLEFTRHRLVVPFIKSYNFGSNDSEASHWLLLDRQERLFYVGKKDSVASFLKSFKKQIPPVDIKDSIDQLNNIAIKLQSALYEKKIDFDEVYAGVKSVASFLRIYKKHILPADFEASIDQLINIAISLQSALYEKKINFNMDGILDIVQQQNKLEQAMISWLDSTYTKVLSLNAGGLKLVK